MRKILLENTNDFASFKVEIKLLFQFTRECQIIILGTRI